MDAATYTLGFPEPGRWVEVWDGDGSDVVQYIGHDVRSTDEEICWDVKQRSGKLRVLDTVTRWSYTNTPSSNELEAARLSHVNNAYGRFCAHCGAVDVTLLKCSRCRRAHFCTAQCQRRGWRGHRSRCIATVERQAAERAPARADPRYPLAVSRADTAAAQRVLSTGAHFIMEAALRRRIVVRRMGRDGIRVRRMRDMTSMDRYALQLPGSPVAELAQGRRAVRWLFREKDEHANGEPAACSFFEKLCELGIDGKCARVKTGGLLYLAVLRPEFLLAFAMNLKEYGSCLPFSKKCQCWERKRPVAWKEMERRFNRLLRRAIADRNDVQCMFAGTPAGCHAFENGCPFRHDVVV